MRGIATFLIFLLVSTQPNLAQNRNFTVYYPDGTVQHRNVGNFTITDSDGNTWTLYNELDKGITIVIDIFQATCMTCLIYAPLIDQVYLKYGSGLSNVNVWGLSRYDDNFMLNEFKNQHNIHHPVAGSEGNAGNAIDILIEGQNFYGTPTYAVICPDRKMFFNVCFPPTIGCFDNYLINCNPILIPGFSAEPQQSCAGGQVQFTDKSKGTISFWHWQFPGGVPEESFDIHPVVTYPVAGNWNVVLTIGNADTTQTLIMNGFIDIMPLPDVTLQPFNPVCHNDPPLVLTGGHPEGGYYYGPGVINGIFYPELAGPGIHPITYEFSDSNGCTGMAIETIEVEICSGLTNQSMVFTTIYPNPTSGILQISGITDQLVSFQFSDLRGRNLLDFVSVIPYPTHALLNLDQLSNGVYILQILHQNKVVQTHRVILLKY